LPWSLELHLAFAFKESEPGKLEAGSLSFASRVDQFDGLPQDLWFQQQLAIAFKE
jgi:hypothetical protein